MCAAGLPLLLRLVARVRVHCRRGGFVVAVQGARRRHDGTTGSEAGFRQIQELCSRHIVNERARHPRPARGRDKGPGYIYRHGRFESMHTIVTSLILVGVTLLH